MTESMSKTARSRRAEPIDKRTARNGAVSYTFQIDVGTKPDGTRDRQRFTYPTRTLAQREYRRISTEIAEGRYSRLTTDTVDHACRQWLTSRRTTRRITIRNYTHAVPGHEKVSAGGHV
ncbi:hypothetical protein [Nocardia aurantia]|uniref:Integrase n=1 Tax=Nocardia aurantia TaxID=2585199 RepID=A0A7K0DYP7_9NOCA|nr:hypothetical protein [Nocardia aurantia]MQY30930.1 hypothetical protein [Nocardia aurantia]